MSKLSQTVAFNLEGRFLGFAVEDGYKLKLIRLATAEGEYQIKIPKVLRPLLYRTLIPGQTVQVAGYQKIYPDKGISKLKADRVTPLSATPAAAAMEPAMEPAMQSCGGPIATPLFPASISSSVSSMEQVPAFAYAAPPPPTPIDRSSRQAISNQLDSKSGGKSSSKSANQSAAILVCQKSDCCKRGANRLMQALQAELDDRGLTDHVKIRGTGCMKQCKSGPALVMPDKSRYTRIRPEQAAGLIDKHFSGRDEIAS